MQKIMNLEETLQSAIDKAAQGQPIEEQKILLTKLKEAQMWLREYNGVLRAKAVKSGVGFNANVHGKRSTGETLAGITLTEEVDLSPIGAPPHHEQLPEG